MLYFHVEFEVKAPDRETLYDEVINAVQEDITSSLQILDFEDVYEDDETEANFVVRFSVSEAFVPEIEPFFEIFDYKLNECSVDCWRCNDITEDSEDLIISGQTKQKMRQQINAVLAELKLKSFVDILNWLVKESEKAFLNDGQISQKYLDFINCSGYIKNNRKAVDALASKISNGQIVVNAKLDDGSQCRLKVLDLFTDFQAKVKEIA
jgi:hypothetical protein